MRALLFRALILEGFLTLHFFVSKQPEKVFLVQYLLGGREIHSYLQVKEFQPFLYSLNKHAYGMKRAFGKRINIHGAACFFL